MFLQDCRMDGGMQATVAKSDVENFSGLLATIRRVKKLLSSWLMPSDTGVVKAAYNRRVVSGDEIGDWRMIFQYKW